MTDLADLAAAVRELDALKRRGRMRLVGRTREHEDALRFADAFADAVAGGAPFVTSRWVPPGMVVVVNPAPLFCWWADSGRTLSPIPSATDHSKPAVYFHSDEDRHRFLSLLEGRPCTP